MTVPGVLFAFFRVLNAGILLFFAVHVFKTYIYPFLREQLRVQLASIRAMHESIRLERARVVAQEQALQQTHQEAQRLLENIQRWRTVVEQNNQQRQATEAQRAQEVQAVYAYQLTQYAQHAAQRQVCAQAFAAARKKLAIEFEQAQRGASFINHTLDHLQQEVP